MKSQVVVAVRVHQVGPGTSTITIVSRRDDEEFERSYVAPDDTVLHAAQAVSRYYGLLPSGDDAQIHDTAHHDRSWHAA